MSILKAYFVQEIFGEGSACIVFAETRGKARADGAMELNREFLEVSIRREKRYDSYEGHVPKEVLFNDGWSFTCDECGLRVDKDQGGVLIGEDAYCKNCFNC